MTRHDPKYGYGGRSCPSLWSGKQASRSPQTYPMFSWLTKHFGKWLDWSETEGLRACRSGLDYG